MVKIEVYEQNSKIDLKEQIDKMILDKHYSNIDILNDSIESVP